MLEWEVRLGDALELLKAIPTASVDAVVTDPPYGIGFMGHEWDQPSLEHSPVRANGQPGEYHNGEPYPGPHVAGGQRRKTQPAPETGAGHARDRVGDHTTTRLRGGAMHAGRYDLSREANHRFQLWCEAWGRECVRVLKPGGYLCAFGSTRTYHRLVSGLEDAGFEVRDTLAWISGSGFPKSLNVAMAVEGEHARLAAAWFDMPYGSARTDARRADLELAARTWLDVEADPEGWGTALKPGYEPVSVLRAPMAGTVALNWRDHGTGAINVDGCRIDASEGRPAIESRPDPAMNGVVYAGRQVPGGGFDGGSRAVGETTGGRWPSTIILDSEAAATLDEHTGQLTSGVGTTMQASSRDRDGNTSPAYGVENRPIGMPLVSYGDTGGGSKFFYCPKVTRAERDAGLDRLPVHDGPLTLTPTSTISKGRSGGRQLDASELEARALNWSNGTESPGTFQSAGTTRGVANFHPTVKPIEVMRWVIRLVTPPGGLVLDLMCGSGSTGCAARLERKRFLGIERDPEYVAIANARIAWWGDHPDGMEPVEILKHTRARPLQESLFDG